MSQAEGIHSVRNLRLIVPGIPVVHRGREAEAVGLGGTDREDTYLLRVRREDNKEWEIWPAPLNEVTPRLPEKQKRPRPSAEALEQIAREFKEKGIEEGSLVLWADSDSPGLVRIVGFNEEFGNAITATAETGSDLSDMPGVKADEFVLPTDEIIRERREAWDASQLRNAFAHTYNSDRHPMFGYWLAEKFFYFRHRKAKGKKKPQGEMIS